MKLIMPVLAALSCVLGCSDSGGWKPGCDKAGSCKAGNYCAHTPDGNVCWPDEAAPVVSGVQVACADEPCLRTSVLHVSATVTDDKAMGGATVTLDLDPEHPRKLQKGSGDTWEADVPLTEVPFPHFEQAVTASVVGRDEAGNATAPAAGAAVSVTRLKWTGVLASASPLVLRSPALLADGTLIVAGVDDRLHFVQKSGALLESRQIAESLGLNGPAVVGDDAIWVGGESGRLYALEFDGTLARSCAAGEAIAGAPAVVGRRVVAATSASYLLVADAAGACVPGDVPATAAPVVSSEGLVFVPAGGKLRSFSVRANGALRDEWAGTPPAPDVGDVQALLAIDGSDAVWTTSVTGPVNRTRSDATLQPVALSPALSGNSTGPIILSDGTAVIGDRVPAVVRRVASSTGITWTSPTLTGSPAIPLALAASTDTLLVPTSRGWVYLLKQSDGTIVWSGRLTASNQSLETPNIWTEPGATTSTVYLAGADGNLYAVIVDGALDTSAPWPKAYHDPQNTSNAGVGP